MPDESMLQDSFDIFEVDSSDIIYIFRLPLTTTTFLLITFRQYASVNGAQPDQEAKISQKAESRRVQSFALPLCCTFVGLIGPSVLQCKAFEVPGLALLLLGCPSGWLDCLVACVFQAAVRPMRLCGDSGSKGPPTWAPGQVCSTSPHQFDYFLTTDSPVFP